MHESSINIETDISLFLVHFFKQVFQYPEERWTISLKYVYITVHSKQIRNKMLSTQQLLFVTEAKAVAWKPSYSTHHNLPQCPKARNVFYCLQWNAGVSVFHHTLQTRQAGRASIKDVSHQELQPTSACWRVTAHCHGLLRVFCTTTHSVPAMPWQHQSSRRRLPALLTHF